MKQRQEYHEAYTRWLADEIQAAIDDPQPSTPHDEVMARMDEQIAALMTGESRPRETHEL
ncbi:MAG: hypothetical protein CBARDCOR_3602 [uncultured Caballeronia sp.]|nr:MAG: hypothetical protein CBARDCOR_3602 [uncultured Caballeronia sp.]